MNLVAASLNDIIMLSVNVPRCAYEAAHLYTLSVPDGVDGATVEAPTLGLSDDIGLARPEAKPRNVSPPPITGVPGMDEDGVKSPLVPLDFVVPRTVCNRSSTSRGFLVRSGVEGTCWEPKIYVSEAGNASREDHARLRSFVQCGLLFPFVVEQVSPVWPRFLLSFCQTFVGGDATITRRWSLDSREDRAREHAVVSLQ